MKLKYYLRGLGIGIVVTAIIMSFTRQPEKLTDAQIKMRAMELGMVEESVLADLQENKETASNEGKDSEGKIPSFEDIVNVEEEEESNSQENTDTEAAKSEESTKNDSESESNLENVSNIESDIITDESNVLEAEFDMEEINTSEIESVMDEMEDSADGTDSNDNSIEIAKEEIVENYIIISVEGGNGSEIISRRLYEAGLVNSAIEFNQYLVKNGYDRKLKVGNHEISTNATEEEMAKILCGMK